MADEKPGEWIINTAGWKVKDHIARTQARLQAQRTGDLSVLFPSCARLVKGWPLALDPADVASYGELEPEDWLEVLGRIDDALNDRFRRRE